jgi:peptide/nickel transport system permease protein
MRLEYVAKRVALFFACVWVAATVNFLLPRLDAGRAARGGPLWDQYLSYVGRCLRLDFGYSSSNYPTPVNDLIAAALPWTLALLGTATVLAFALGCLLGGLLAWPGSPRFLRVLAPPIFALQALPYYVFGLLLMWVFVFRLKWFPLMGGYTEGSLPGPTVEFALDLAYHSILPALSIILVAVGGWGLLTRGLVVTNLADDYMLFAEAKGLRSHTLFFRYAMRNALLPQVTVLALSLSQIVSGAILVEQVFAYPGIGRLLTLSIKNSDYNLLGGVVFIIIVGVSLATLILDLAYPLLDPRIQTGRA